MGTTHKLPAELGIWDWGFYIDVKVGDKVKIINDYNLTGGSLYVNVNPQTNKVEIKINAVKDDEEPIEVRFKGRAKRAYDYIWS